MHYTKKQVTIEAVLWDGNHISEVTPWISEALRIYDMYTPGALMRVGDMIYISTLEGVMKASPGDYIIRGLKGELYPCKPNIFNLSYDPTPIPQINASTAME